MTRLTPKLHSLMTLVSPKSPPKGEKVYPASRRRSNKRVGLLRTAGSSFCAMIKKFYRGIQKAVHQFRFKNVEQHLLLWSGGNQNLRPSCRRPTAKTFHTLVGTLRLDAPALVRVRSPNDGNKLG